MLTGRYRHSERGTTFVDEETERRNAGLLLAAMAAFCISGWYSSQELWYAARGQTLDANVTRMHEFTVSTRYGQSPPRLRIEYSFLDASQQPRTGRDWVPLPSNLQGAATVPIQYLSGANGKTRLLAKRSFVGPLVFLICCGTAAYFLIRLINEAGTPLRRGRQRPPNPLRDHPAR